MNTNEVELAEQRLNYHASLAFYHQGLWLLLLALLSFSNIPYVKEAGQCLGVCALLSSFIASRLYIAAGRQVEGFKSFSSEKLVQRKKEYATKFFSPYVLWVGVIIRFSTW